MVWAPTIPAYQPITPPYNMPYGGSRGAKRQRTGGTMTTTDTLKKKRRPNKRLVRSFKRKVLNVFGAKHFSGQSETTINDNIFQCMNLTSQIGQGTAQTQREGDSIHLEALKIEGAFQADTDSNAYIFRLIIGYSRHENNNTSVTSAVWGTDAPFLANTTSNIVNAHFNPKSFTVLYDQKIDMNSQVEGDRTIQSFRDTIKLDKTFVYKDNGSQYGKNKNLYVIALGYRPDTVNGDAIGSLLLTWDLIFKD